MPRAITNLSLSVWCLAPWNVPSSCLEQALPETACVWPTAPRVHISVAVNGHGRRGTQVTGAFPLSLDTTMGREREREGGEWDKECGRDGKGAKGGQIEKMGKEGVWGAERERDGEGQVLVANFSMYRRPPWHAPLPRLYQVSMGVLRASLISVSQADVIELIVLCLFCSKLRVLFSLPSPSRFYPIRWEASLPWLWQFKSGLCNW